MPITQVVTALPTPPNPATDTATTFSSKAQAFTVAQAAMGPELNAVATQANALETNVNAKEASATTSAATATTQATAAAGSATSASGSATTATTQAAAAASSAASVAGAAATVAYIYAGTFASAPTTRPGGSAIQSGDVYFNSTANLTYRWNGTSWVASDINTANLAASTGATLIGAVDGASGSLWTTVAAFIAKIISSAGSSVIGFIQAGTGAVQRNLQSKLRERVSAPDFGAVANNSTDNAAFVLNAIASLPAGGGLIHLPASANAYVLNASPLDFSGREVIMTGEGWKCLVQDVFGGSQWSAAGSIAGTVFRATGTNNGFDNTFATGRGVGLRDFGLIGPGSGTSVGVNLGSGGQNNNALLWNVMVANFATGLKLSNSIDDEFYNFKAWGCSSGVDIHDNANDLRFINLDVQKNAIGLNIECGAGIWVVGGLIQANTVGIVIKPLTLGIQGLLICNTWSEGNTTGLVLDTTNAAISDIAFRDSRDSSSYTLDATLVNALSRVSFENLVWTGVTIKLKPGWSQVFMKNVNCAALDLSAAADASLSLQRFNVNGVSSTCYNTATIASAATITPDYTNGQDFFVVLTGPTTINAPINAPRDAEVTFFIRQDGTGGRTLTFGANYHVVWSDTGNVANKYSSITFKAFPGGQWIQKNAQSPYV